MSEPLEDSDIENDPVDYRVRAIDFDALDDDVDGGEDDDEDLDEELDDEDVEGEEDENEEMRARRRSPLPLRQSLCLTVYALTHTSRKITIPLAPRSPRNILPSIMDRLNTQTRLRRCSTTQPLAAAILAIRRPSTTYTYFALLQSRGHSQDPCIP